MLSVVKGELFKFLRQPLLKIILFVSLAVVCIQVIPFRQMLAELMELEIAFSEKPTGHNAFVASSFAGFFSFFIPFLVVTVFSSEFTKKTIRNIGTINLPRRGVFIGKYISFALMVFFLMFFLAGSSTIVFAIFRGWGSDSIFLDISRILYYVIISAWQQISYASVIILLTLYIYNDALIVLLYFGLSLIESIIASVLVSLSRHVKALTLIAYAFPSSYSHKLTALPVQSGKFAAAVTAMTVSILLTLVLGSTIFKKRDITV